MLCPLPPPGILQSAKTGESSFGPRKRRRLGGAEVRGTSEAARPGRAPRRPGGRSVPAEPTRGEAAGHGGPGAAPREEVVRFGITVALLVLESVAPADGQGALGPGAVRQGALYQTAVSFSSWLGCERGPL